MRYGLVAASGYVLALALFAVMVEVGISPYVAAPVVFVANGAYNFLLFRAFSFPAGSMAAGSQVGRFVGVAGVSLVVNYGVLYALYGVLGVDPVPAQAVAVATAAPVGFLGNKLWTFA
ncbi:MAG TPA: GtrA family protein [Solirubrobacterales bacterium]|nr:GtrA family protein [Solirubrobacterales bacterium]